MNPARLYSVLREPHVTEKMTNIGDQSNQYGFKVATDATKAEIRTAVETIFDVKVLRVTTVNVKGKVKVRLGRQTVSRGRAWKKAYVRLADGDEIDTSVEIK